MKEMMQHYWLTLSLRVALTLCMLSHDGIIQRALENAGHRKRQINIYMYKIGAFFSASHNLRISACLFHIKSLYNVEPDKISRIMYLIMFWSVTSRSSNEKWAIAWENLSFGIDFTEEASGSIIRMRGSRGPDRPPPPLEIHKFYINVCPPPPPGKIWTPSPVTCWIPSGTLKNIVSLKINHWYPSVKKLMLKNVIRVFSDPPPPWRKFLDPRMILP